jgi:hypothetical protein
MNVHKTRRQQIATGLDNPSCLLRGFTFASNCADPPIINDNVATASGRSCAINYSRVAYDQIVHG